MILAIRFSAVATAASVLALSAPCLAQSSESNPAQLTLDQALALAKTRNGTVKAAQYDYLSAKNSVTQSLSAFFPTITPVYQYNSDRSSTQTSGGPVFFQNEGGTSYVTSSWRLLDTGQRQLKLLASRRNEESSKADTLETLRTTLYGVTSQYLEALRSQELLKVSDSQVQRAETVLDQTKAQVKVGDVAAKEILQAQADVLNARVTYLTAKNRYTNALAALKSIIGWDNNSPLPTLSPVDAPGPVDLPGLDTLIKDGVQARPDLISARKSVDALRYGRDLAERNALPTASLDAGFDQTLTPHSLESRTLTFTVSAPLFDGGLSRAQARQAKLQWLSAQASYTQRERDAKAEIEAAYATQLQNAERITAAKSARDAAEENYKAASESQKAGASNLIDVLTAEVSLVTAESNYIEALYDYILSDVNLKLVTGKPVPGETA